MLRRLLFAPTLALALAACAAAPAGRGVPPPTVSHHQHLISDDFGVILKRDVRLDGAGLVAQLDAAGIRKAVVLSMGYTYGDERKGIADHPQKTRAENDWTSAQVSRFPRRLIGFCGVNPLLDTAIAEIERCLRLPGMKGIKLHLGNSGVDVTKPEHARRLAAFFAVANRNRAPIVAHMRIRGGEGYGRAHGEAFLEQVLPAAPDIVVQVAHMAGAGPGYDASADAAIGPLAEAVARGDPRTRRLWFDATTVVRPDSPAEETAMLVRRIRQIGPRRVVFGADLALPDSNPPPAEAWALFRTLPLTDAEFTAIARNVAPYAR